ncbi:hypothetical protein CgunFtcFv8_014822 [Champsocephalus gunnari]|uniref:Uncharacterized protein n=1 Tax=Champsocephalus gunnari TaxID=52237 RepID=A0AAN8E628_CHAGU|nr:hypothetical protein CgunFtcFv8_014822 [Champsocephalus gunnari]
MGAEESCSVTADPFSSPVSLVFVVSDVSTKACPAVRNNKPPPDDRTATATPVLHRDQRHLSPATLPQTPSDTHTHQRALLSPRSHS